MTGCVSTWFEYVEAALAAVGALSLAFSFGVVLVLWNRMGRGS